MSDLPSWCRVGAKVAWVGEGMQNMHPVFHPSNGTVFTIADVVPGSSDSDDYTMVAVVEMRNTDGFGPWWNINRFRPVVEDKSDNEIEAKLYHKKGLHQSAPRRKSVEA